jgi:hypothetical protein
VVECTALEMRHRCKPIGGSNPSLSASSTHIALDILANPAVRRVRCGARWELHQFDMRVMARCGGQTFVARQQGGVERLGQRDIGGVIGRQIIP